MAFLVALVLLTLAPVVLGQYDTLEHRATETWPSRLKQLRDSLLDSGMYQEAMFHVLSIFVPTDSDNSLCSNHSSLLQLAFLEDQFWAIKMMDASSKLGDGMFQGNFQGLGSYDECLSAEEPSHQFSGQLCVVQTRDVLPAVVPNSGTSEFSLTQALPLDLALSVCVPSTCAPGDVLAHWQGVLAELNASASLIPRDCSIRGDIHPEPRTWVALGVLAALFLVILASTCFDYSVAHQPTKEQRILVCFSAFNNLRKLFNTERRADSLDVLDGVRFLAISWIVLGHRFEQSLQVPTFTLLNTEKYTTAWFMSPVLNMMMAVELFFLLSGCLLTYHFLQARVRGEQFSLTHFYYKRYIRLTPALAMVMMLEGCLMFYVSDGALWKRLVGNRMDACLNFWWTNLLYVSNYVNPYRTCVLQTWYLSADMQLYLLSPLLLWPLSHSRRGLLLLAACYATTTAAAFCNALYLQLPAGATVTLDKKTERNHGFEYVKTHVRAASWLTGMALGYILHSHRKNPWNISKMAAASGWVVSVCLCLVAVYSIAPFQPPQHHYSPLLDSLHIALHRNMFSLGAAGILLLCVAGKGGCIKDFLGWKGFRPLATISYGVYLCHMGMQTVGLARIRQPYTFDMFTLFTSYMSDLLLANLMAILLYISVEAPCWEIGRWLYNTEKELKVTVIEASSNINLEEEKSVL